jgi:hypothetical protein
LLTAIADRLGADFVDFCRRLSEVRCIQIILAGNPDERE